MAKKPTNKEIVAKVEMLTRVNNTVIDMVDNLGSIIKEYIAFKGDTKDLQEHLMEQKKRKDEIMRGANG